MQKEDLVEDRTENEGNNSSRLLGSLLSRAIPEALNVNEAEYNEWVNSYLHDTEKDYYSLKHSATSFFQKLFELSYHDYRGEKVRQQFLERSPTGFDQKTRALLFTLVAPPSSEDYGLIEEGISNFQALVQGEPVLEPFNWNPRPEHEFLVRLELNDTSPTGNGKCLEIKDVVCTNCTAVNGWAPGTILKNYSSLIAKFRRTDAQGMTIAVNFSQGHAALLTMGPYTEPYPFLHFQGHSQNDVHSLPDGTKLEQRYAYGCENSQSGTALEWKVPEGWYFGEGTNLCYFNGEMPHHRNDRGLKWGHQDYDFVLKKGTRDSQSYTSFGYNCSLVTPDGRNMSLVSVFDDPTWQNGLALQWEIPPGWRLTAGSTICYRHGALPDGSSGSGPLTCHFTITRD